jgi:hypothetical protein
LSQCKKEAANFGYKRDVWIMLMKSSFKVI